MFTNPKPCNYTAMIKHLKLAVCGFLLVFALPACAQNRLTPYSYDWMRNFSRQNYVCWGYRVETSFDGNYEIRCIRNAEEQKYYLVMDDMQKKYEIDEELAYQLRTLFDVAVYSSGFLPESIGSALEELKTGNAQIEESGMDGEMYYFYNNRYGACCWSPSGGNNLVLEKIGEALVYAFNGGGITFQLSDIRKLTEAYIEQLQEQYREYFTLRMDKMPSRWWLQTIS